MIFGSAVFVNTSLGTDVDYLSWWHAKTEQLKAELKQVFQKALDSLSLSGIWCFWAICLQDTVVLITHRGLSCEFITVMSVCVKSLCHTESTFILAHFERIEAGNGVYAYMLEARFEPMLLECAARFNDKGNIF